MLGEVDYDELDALGDVRPVPRPGEDEPRRRRDFTVLAAAPELLAVRAAHDEPQPAADAQVDLGDRRVPVRARRIPAAQQLGACPGLEHHLRSEEHTSELQSRRDLVCRLLLEKKKKNIRKSHFYKKKKYTKTNI